MQGGVSGLQMLNSWTHDLVSGNIHENNIASDQPILSKYE